MAMRILSAVNKTIECIQMCSVGQTCRGNDSHEIRAFISLRVCHKSHNVAAILTSAVFYVYVLTSHGAV